VLERRIQVFRAWLRSEEALAQPVAPRRSGLPCILSELIPLILLILSKNQLWTG
jgi:hypothetical protein